MMRSLIAVALLSASALSAHPISADKPVSAPPSDATSLKMDQLVLEEYKIVREEIILCLQTRVNVLSLGFAAIGAILSVGVAAATGRKPKWIVAGLTIGLGATFTSLFVCDLWMEETQRLQRASFHNHYLELKMASLFPSGTNPPLEWERRVKTKEYETEMPTDSGTPRIFLYVASFSLVGGVYFCWLQGRTSRYRKWLLMTALTLGIGVWAFNVPQRFHKLRLLDDRWSVAPHFPSELK